MMPALMPAHRPTGRARFCADGPGTVFLCEVSQVSQCPHDGGRLAHEYKNMYEYAYYCAYEHLHGLLVSCVPSTGTPVFCMLPGSKRPTASEVQTTVESASRMENDER